MTRNSRTAIVVAFVVALGWVAAGAPTTVLASPTTAPASPAGSPAPAQVTGPTVAQTGAQQDGNLVVEAVAMPSIATPGRFDGTATLRNPGTTEVTDDVSFRFEGGEHDIVITQRVTVPANATVRVTFSLDTSNFEPDDYVAGVTTANSSELEEVELSTTADVDIDQQDSDGTTVTVDSVFLPEGGYVVIHNESLAAGDAIGSTIGTSAYLGPGYHEDVNVTLYDVPGAQFDTDRLPADERLVAMAHVDSDGDRRFEFVATDGSVDGPALDEGQPVIDAANVTVTGGGTPGG